MKKLFLQYGQWLLSAALVLSFAFAKSVVSQHQGHKMPASKPESVPSPSPSPTPSPTNTHVHTPGMIMPGASPTPTTSPAATTHAGMPGMDPSEPMSDKSLMVMTGNDMSIRVGASDTNVMSMGAMGSGTAWQPSSAPLYMHHQQAGDWLLMFHYNFVAGGEFAGRSARCHQV